MKIFTINRIKRERRRKWKTIKKNAKNKHILSLVMVMMELKKAHKESHL